MRYDIAIVGGGIVGGSLACALSAQGLSIALLDALPVSVPDNKEWALRVSAITPASKRMLEQLGVWSAIPAERLSPYKKMTVWESSAGGERGEIRFDCSELGLDELGYIVENEQIQHAIYQRIAGLPNVTLVCPARLNGLDFDGHGAHLLFEQQPDIEAALVVGADGRGSLVRQLAGLGVSALDYAEQAIVATVRTGKPHQQTAWQRFVVSTEQARPLAFLPLPDAHQASIVWSAHEDEAVRLTALDELAFNQALTHAFDGRLGQVELSSRRACFPLQRQHAKRYIADRLVLIGDAAHSVHPLAGQGLNMGLADVYCLAQVLMRACRQDKHYWREHRLRPYERQRKAENTILIGICEGLRRVFLAPEPPMGFFRRNGLALVNRIGPLKHQMIRYAAGQGASN